jgi:putative ABC transport system permease protein
MQDLRIGVRALRRAPAFTLVAVLTLALAIGATTAVFTVVYTVLIKPLPFPDAGALVSLKHTSLNANPGPPVGMSATLLLTYTRENKSFQQIGVWARDTANVTGGVLPEEVTTLNVSVGTLRALGIQPAMGRWFTEEDHQLGAAETVILIHGYWQRRFGGDRSIVGKQVLIDGSPRTIVGVMPARFRFLNESPDVVLPARFEPATLTLGRFNYEGVARLAPGVTIEQARADVARMIPIWIESWPPFPGLDRSVFVRGRMTPLMLPLKQEFVGKVGDMLWVVMGTIAIVLLIACTNVANLVLVRAESRHHELAIRTALGAGRGRLARAMLLESLVVGLVSGVCGLPLAWAGIRLLRLIGPSTLPRLNEIEIDPIVLIFAFLISVVSALLLGIIPVIKYTGGRTALGLRGGARTATDSRERHRTRSTLVVVQVALALTLLVSSGLMIRTVLALRAVPPGFMDPDHVQLVRVTIPDAQVRDPEQVFRLQRAMRDRIAGIPQVADASFTGFVPLANERSRAVIAREDATSADLDAPPVMRWFRYVAPTYFRTIGTQVVAGRDFTWPDLDERRPVVVISENLARELWREPQAALGRRIREGAGSPWREIIGVVGDVHDGGLHEAAPAIVYWPSVMEGFNGQRVSVRRSVTFAIRTSRAGSETLLGQVRDAIAAVNADVPLTRVRTLGDVYDGSLATTSFTLLMLAVAAGIALILGIVGIYGVIAYAVTQRRREIGIRVALGAGRREVKGMFLRQGVALGLIGVVCGMVSAALLTRLMASLLFGTSPLDPATYGLVSAGLVAVAALASYVPAHAATAVDPASTLRGE